MQNLASVDDLQTLMGAKFSDGELAQAELVLGIVSSWVRVVSGQPWPDAPTGVPSDVAAVVLQASKRELRNPDRLITESMGPFSVTFSAPPDGFFYPAELALLQRFRKTGGLRVVQTTRGEIGRPYAGRLPWSQFDDSRVSYYGQPSQFLDYGGSPFPAFVEDDDGVIGGA